jgi:hypothetical protein
MVQHLDYVDVCPIEHDVIMCTSSILKYKEFSFILNQTIVTLTKFIEKKKISRTLN